jgi:hypothetical protein
MSAHSYSPRHDIDLQAPVHHARVRFAAGIVLIVALFLAAFAMVMANLVDLHG